MKLTPMQTSRAARQIKAWAAPEDDPAARWFSDFFGEHTFFLDRHGLSIVEPMEDQSTGDVELGRVIKVAGWLDAACTVLSPHPWEITSVVVTLDGPLPQSSQRAAPPPRANEAVGRLESRADVS